MSREQLQPTQEIPQSATRSQRRAKRAGRMVLAATGLGLTLSGIVDINSNSQVAFADKATPTPDTTTIVHTPAPTQESTVVVPTSTPQDKATPTVETTRIVHTPAPSNTPEKSTPTTVAGTHTPAPTETLTPIPTITSTPKPGETPTATPTRTSTPTATRTATPQVVVTVENLPSAGNGGYFGHNVARAGAIVGGLLLAGGGLFSGLISEKLGRRKSTKVS